MGIVIDDDYHHTIREKVLDVLSNQYERVQNVPQEILNVLPFIDPQMIFKIRDKNVALLLENKVRTPMWVRHVQKYEDILKQLDFEIGIITLCEDPYRFILPSYIDIHRAFTNNIGLYLIRDKEIFCIFHKSLINNCEKFNKDQIEPFITRIDKNKRIPNILTEKMHNLKNIFLSDILKDIAIEYESKQFKESREEYDFIQQAMEDILKENRLADLERTLNFLRLTENELRSKGKRDHFLHSFQVFLLGEIIIDTHLDILKEMLLRDNSDKISLERTWLMASLLHDIGVPFQNREWIEGIGDYQINLLDDIRNRHFIDDLVLYFSRIKGNSSEDKIRNIFYSRAEQTDDRGQSAVNHGLISAIQLLRKTVSVPKTFYENEVLPAALSMAMHDRELWYDLFREKLLPIDAHDFPIISLLILCDHLQGWGRPGRKDDPQGKDIILTDLDVNYGDINVKIWFRDIPDALLFGWETKEILNFVISTKDLFKVNVYQVL